MSRIYYAMNTNILLSSQQNLLFLIMSNILNYEVSFIQYSAFERRGA